MPMQCCVCKGYVTPRSFPIPFEPFVCGYCCDKIADHWRGPESRWRWRHIKPVLPLLLMGALVLVLAVALMHMV